MTRHPRNAATAEPRRPIAADSDQPAVVVTSVDKNFPRPAGEPLKVLDDVSLTVARGEFLCVVGPSGCGKTTLLRLIQGLDQATSGHIRIEGREPGHARTGYVFQSSSLLPWRTLRRNISFGRETRAFRRDARRTGADRDTKERVDDLLRITGLKDFADYYPAELSGGMQQRANLARALAIEPEVLLMDEPFGALDAITKGRLQRDLQIILDRVTTTTIFITHDIREAVYLGDRVLVMSPRPGRFTFELAVKEPRPRTQEFQEGDRAAELARQVGAALRGTEG